MSQHYGDYEDFLRGALHAAVDSAEPAGDGLERIRARLTTPRPLPVAWLLAACSWVARYARGSLESVSAWLQTVPGEVHRRDGAAEGRYIQRLRLVATVAAVTVLLAISVSTLTPFGRHVISQAGSVLNSIGGGTPAGTGEQAPNGQGGGGAGAAGTTNGGQNHAQPAASCTPGASALAVPPAKTSPAGPSPASTSPASPPAASTGPASPPAASTGPDSTSPSSPPQASTAPVPTPSPSPSPAGSTSASASAAGSSPTSCASPAASPSPKSSSPSPPPASTAPASPPSTAPASPPPASTAPASPGPSSSPDSSSSSAVSPASTGSDSTGNDSTGPSGPPPASPAPATDPGLSRASAGPEGSASG
jgi:hypothetical protein